MFDSQKTGKIETEKIRTILNTLGQSYDDDELQELIEKNDPEGKIYRNVCIIINIFDSFQYPRCTKIEVLPISSSFF